MHILQVGSNVIVCRDVEASDGVSIRTLVESCIRVKRFPQADVGLNPKENAWKCQEMCSREIPKI